MRKSSSPDITFDERLSEKKARIEAQLKETEPGPQHRLLRRRLQRIETAFQIERWLTSKELAVAQMGCSGGGDSTMIVECFDRRTMAAMEIALEKACGCWPNGGQHNLRKRAAKRIIQCAKTGSTSLSALIEAGERAIAAKQQGIS